MNASVSRDIADFAHDVFTGEHDDITDGIMKGESPDTVDWLEQEWQALNDVSARINLHNNLVNVTDEPPKQSF